MALQRLLKPLGPFQPDNARDSLEEWFDSKLGLLMLEKQKHLLEDVLPKFFGYHMLYSGFESLTPTLDTSPIRHKVFLDSKCKKNALKSDIHQLPFQSDSTDLVVLQHSLDFEKDPFQILREASRVVLPNGNLVVIGFNPWSLWGIWRAALFRSTKAPWNTRFISPYRLSEWLDILGFDVLGCESAFFMPPSTRLSKNESTHWVDRLGSRWLAQRGGFYLLVAKKRVSCITPIRLQDGKKRAQILPIASASKIPIRSEKLPFDKH